MRLFPLFLIVGVIAGVLQAAEQPFSWQNDQAEVVETGDLRWAPRPFAYQAGRSVRFIDFEQGDDDNPGTSKDRPWKHHPWDSQATGKAQAARGIHTYVFKRGVVYRGSLVARDAGEPGNPVRLTSDPAWGRGDAGFYGSEAVRGWRRGAEHKDIPEKDKVWYVDLDFLPRRVWMVDGEAITRIPLARTPNWKVSDQEDVLSEWWAWQNPQWWVEKNRTTTVGSKKMHLGIDRINLTQGADYYTNATVWTEWAIVMGTPFPTKVESVDSGGKALAFQGRWWGASGQIHAGNRYFLENKPHYLDDPDGEFWFERQGSHAKGRLFLRLPGDREPNAVTVEVARHFSLIEDPASGQAPPRTDVLKPEQRTALDITGLRHVEISGLVFRFSNIHWDYEQPPWMHKDIDAAAIRSRGASDGLVVANCRFEHVSAAVRVDPITDQVLVGSIALTDNDIRFIDHGAINIGGRGSRDLGDVRVMRNNLFMIGMRPYRQSDGHALTVRFPETMEVAGNILTRCYGAGIFVFGGKGSGQGGEVPLSRHLIYQNRVVDSLLAANDWGGIETWQGGPFYVFNNVSGNPSGLWNWSYQKSRNNPDVNGRLGFAYYLDGGFKNYLFNNIAWGIASDPKHRDANNSAFYQAVPCIHNAFFNNTAYRFKQGSGWSPAGGRQVFLGNLWHDISMSVFNHGKQKEDADAQYKEYPHETIAYSNNVFFQIPEGMRDVGGDAKKSLVLALGALEGSGHGPGDLERFRRMAEERKLLASDVGVMAGASPLRDAAKGDFRPAPGSAVIDRGVKSFVPWGLFAMVGEWNFRRNNADPSVIFDDHWFMTDYYRNREHYRLVPTFDLRGVNITTANYVQGSLEDWTAAALVLNGRDQYAKVPHGEMIKPFNYTQNKEDVTVQGAAIASPDIHGSNLLVEVVFRTAARHVGGVVVCKMDGGTGYQLAVNANNGMTFTVSTGGRSWEVVCRTQINDGAWHHVIAELDRVAGTGTIYVDGKRTTRGPIAVGNASLSNAGDLLVGKGVDGGHLAGAFDFLRIARGTLAEARTTIEELYAWQFDGPFLRDFTGRKPTGQRRDAGALEFTDR